MIPNFRHGIFFFMEWLANGALVSIINCYSMRLFSFAPSKSIYEISSKPSELDVVRDRARLAVALYTIPQRLPNTMLDRLFPLSSHRSGKTDLSGRLFQEPFYARGPKCRIPTTKPHDHTVSSSYTNLTSLGLCVFLLTNSSSPGGLSFFEFPVNML